MDFHQDISDRPYESSSVDFEFRDYGGGSEGSEKIKPRAKRRAPPHIPGHNSSPILIDEVVLVLNEGFVPRCFRHKNWKVKVDSGASKPLNLLDHIKDPYDYVARKLIKMAPPPGDFQFNQMVNLAAELTGIHILNTLHPTINGGLTSKEHVENYMAHIKGHILACKPKLIEDFKLMKYVEEIKNSMCQVEYNHGDFLRMGNMTLDGDLVLISDGPVNYLMPTSLLLSALDKIQGRFPLKYYWALCDAIGKYGSLSILDRGTEIIRIMESLRLKSGQDFFTFIKEWDALVKGKILTHEGESGTHELYNSTKRDCDELLEKIGWPDFPWETVLPPDRDEPSPLDSSLWLELVGIAKIFGHPVLRGTDALKPLMKYGRSNQGDPKFSTIRSVMGQCKKDFTREYYSKMKKLPAISQAPIEIVELIGSQEERKIFELSEDIWFLVEFGKTLPYDDTPDCIELIKDSACGVPLSHWYQMYDTCGFSHLYNKKKPRFSHTEGRRVIMNFLKKDGKELKETLEKRSLGVTDYDDRVVYLVMKEGELNVDGRAFTEQTYSQRLVQTSMEHNIASIIFRYVPQQSMTSSDLANINRIQGQLKFRPGYFKLYISLDLKKWCIHQRYHNTFHIGEMYDQLFGTGVLFQESHKFFLGSCIMNGNRLCPPDIDSTGMPIPGPHYLNDFLGGLEGMHQKKWTHFAVSVISLALSRGEYPGENIGQGDNQLIVLDIPEDQRFRVKEIRENFLASLTQLFRETGHVLKPLETWASAYLHEYGKKLTYAGVSISDGTKKASNIIPDVNDGLATHQTCISTINTATEGVARGDGSPIPAFFLNQSLVANYLQRKGFISKLDSSVAKKMMLCPADFGGLPLSTLSNHLVRGLSDKVSIWISLLKTIQVYDEGLAKSVIKTWNLGKDGAGIASSQRARLLEDIYCLNLEPLPSIGSKIAEEGLKYLKSSEVKNPLIRTLANEDFGVRKTDLVETLCSMDPLPIGVASAIYANTNTGILSGLSKQFTKSKTVEAFTNSQDGSYLSQSQANDKKVVRMMKSKMGKPLPRFSDLILENECPFFIAKTLRKFNWGVELLNATQPTQFHQVIIRSGDTRDFFNPDRTILIETSTLAQLDVRNIYTKRGPKNPYMGGMTGEKIKKTGTTDIVVKTSIEKAYSTLHKIRSYTEGAPNLWAWMGPLLQEKIDLLGDNYDPARLEHLEVEVSSGNVFHRLFSAAESPYAIVNTNPSVCTHFFQSSDMMAPMTANGEDYNLFFQAAYSCGIRVISLLGEVTGEIKPEYLSTFECQECTHQVTDLWFDLPDNVVPPKDYGLPILSVGPSLPKSYPETLMIKAVAEVLASNVDSNFRAFNLTSEKERSNTHIPVPGISYNDLRRLDFRRLFTLTIVKSKYLRGVVKGWPQESGLTGTHFALFGIGEMLVRASLVPVVVSHLGGNPTMHNSTISTAGVANYLGSIAFETLRQNQQDALNLILGVLFKDEMTFPGTPTAEEESNFFTIRRKLHWNDPVETPTQVRCCVLKQDILSLWKRTNPPQYVVKKDPTLADQIPIPDVDATKMTSLLPKVYGVKDGPKIWDSSLLSYIPRTLGCISSAATKYLEILIHFNIPHHNLGLIACLAEGSGSVLTTLAACSPKARLIYNTLLGDGVDSRESPCVRYPPALVARGIPTDRLSYTTTFMMGTTDILHAHFVEKAMGVFRLDPPDIVTMDAESPSEGGSNMGFLRIWGPDLVTAKIGVIIFKMFWVPGLPDMVGEVIGDTPWFLWKPVSSNPGSREVFCVFGESITQQMINHASPFRSAVIPHLSQKDLRLTEAQARNYALGGADLGLMLAKKYPKTTHLSTKWSLTLPVGACSSICLRVVINLLRNLNSINSHTKLSPPLILNAVRSRNTQRAIEDIIRRIILIYCLNSDNDIMECLKESCVITLSSGGIEEWRKENSRILSFESRRDFSPDGVVYGDCKAMIRDRALFGRCLCRRLKIDGEIGSLASRLSLELRENRVRHPWRVPLGRLSIMKFSG